MVTIKLNALILTGLLFKVGLNYRFTQSRGIGPLLPVHQGLSIKGTWIGWEPLLTAVAMMFFSPWRRFFIAHKSSYLIGSIATSQEFILNWQHCNLDS